MEYRPAKVLDCFDQCAVGLVVIVLGCSEAPDTVAAAALPNTPLESLYHVIQIQLLNQQVEL